MGKSTDELRAKLDELGVKWWPDVYYRDTNTCWRVGDFEWRASEQKDGKLLIGCTCVKYLTPEQAIAATVGVGTLTAEQVRECVNGVYYEGYGDGATHRVNGIEKTDWQTIADKLNATLGAGTCNIEKTHGKSPIDGKEIVTYKCSECDTLIGADSRYCNQCGARVVSE